MSDNQNSLECNTICWGIAAGVGVVAMVMLYMVADFSALQAIFTGGLIGFLLGIVLSLFICRGQKAASDLHSDEKPAQRYAREAAEDKARRTGSGGASAPAAGGSATAAAASAAGGAAATASTTPSSAFQMQDSAPLAGQKDLSDRKGDWKYDSGQDASPAKAAAKPAAKSAAKPAAKAKPAKEAKTKRAPAAADGKPELFTSPSEGAADDLKLISGVGPKLEQTLNEMGIWYFKQVAGWRKKEIAWVDDRLRFKGRIERDDWISQAKILAKGGETEFSKRKKK
ncbi:NADH:quinone oxidoreductase [Sulfitobacter sp. JB4-11]|uniref:NADH:quinone oxidoreductase n=1 Tax=Sulfitobacter rhodophyticola TaxID=3238304 RepID=UPI0035181BDE